MVTLQGRSISIQNQVNWVKSKIYNLGVRCYRHSSAARQLFDGASIAFGQAIGLSLNPNYRYGEIQQAIRRQPEFSNIFKPEVLPSDLISKPEISQSGISKKAKNEKAWKLIDENISENLLDKTMYFALKISLAGICAGFGASTFMLFDFSLGSVGAFIKTGVGITGFAAASIIVARAIIDEIRSIQHRNISFDFLRAGEKGFLKDKYHSMHKQKKIRFIEWLQKVDSGFASELKSSG